MPVVVSVGAVGLKVGPVIKFIRSDRLLLLREIFVVMDKTHCCGIIITASPELPGIIRSHIIEDICIFIPTPPSTDFPRSESLNSLLSKLKLISLSSGILVVNVQWRGRAYVGALFDSSRQKNINQNR